MNGIPSKREASVQPASISGLKLNASRAVGGRRTQIGMLIDLEFKQAIAKVRLRFRSR
jgi:hypothetical protein